MKKIGFDFPREPRKTALYKAEDCYQKLLSSKMNKQYEPIKRSNFGEYDMAINYLTSVLEEAKAIEKVAVFNIDHMAQIKFYGKDAEKLLDRVLPANIASMKIGQCKYSLLLTENGTVLDDLIIMRLKKDEFILVINAGHDITDESKNIISDADFIAKYKKSDEEVEIKDISNEFAKIDVQGPLSYKLITKLYGNKVVKNRNNPEKNMPFFTFNEFEYEGYNYIISRTGYTNRWGWELYVPIEVAVKQFKKIVNEALELGGLLVGLGGRDENRISAGNFGLPLNGSEYDKFHSPVNAPLFKAAVDLSKDDFIGKKALDNEISQNPQKRMVILISEGISTGRGIYLMGKRVGTVTSSINSPNISQEKREFIGSKRKNVLGANGTAAINLAWLSINPFQIDEKGNDILEVDGNAVRIKIELYREDENKKPYGKPLSGFISGDGINISTAAKPLKIIEKL